MNGIYYIRYFKVMQAKIGHCYIPNLVTVKELDHHFNIFL